MSKFKKVLLSILTLVFATSFAVACGGGMGDGDTSSLVESSSSVQEESSSVQEESSSVQEESSEEESDESSSEEVHTCITEGEWKTNSSGHWLKCTCGKFVQYGSHEGTATTCGEQAVCTKCKAPFGDPKDHEYGDLSDGEYGKAYYCDCGEYIANEDLVDFIVEVESGRDPVVLQLSDTQTCNWGDLDKMCNNYVRETVEATKPDLIILTGDIVYGRFDPNGTLLNNLIDCMESFEIPWAPIFGNHDNESLMGVDWQCQQLEAAEHCLFKQGDISGNGNYTVGLEQDGKLLRVFYMMDSNGCSKPMCNSEGVQTTPDTGTNEVVTSAGFTMDQILWFTNDITEMHAIDDSIKISFAYHIQNNAFVNAFNKYDEYDGSTAEGSNSILANPLNLDTLETADATDFGYLGRTAKGPWDVGNAVFNRMKNLGVDSIFVGHEHCNSASIVYDGVRFQYGQKSSTYDRYNVLQADGTIVSNQEGSGTPLIGGTVIPVSSEDGSIGTGYIYYCGDPFAEEEPEPVIEVEGLQYGTDLTAQSDESASFGKIEAVAYDENTNAYYMESGTAYNRMYINVELLKGKTTVSFDILLPKEATKADGTATQEFAIRVKPNQTEETMPGVESGYLWYDASYTGDRKVVIGEWQTITVDISGFADVCTEFGIYLVGGGNGAYIKNVAVC